VAPNISKASLKKPKAADQGEITHAPVLCNEIAGLRFHFLDRVDAVAAPA
jgi:hypothetical protein